MSPSLVVEGAAGSTSPAAATGRALSREIWIDTDIVIDNVIEDRVLLTQPLTLATSSLGHHHRQFFIERAEVYRCFPYSVCGTTKTIFFAVGGATGIFLSVFGVAADVSSTLPAEPPTKYYSL